MESEISLVLLAFALLWRGIWLEVSHYFKAHAATLGRGCFQVFVFFVRIMQVVICIVIYLYVVVTKCTITAEH